MTGEVSNNQRRRLVHRLYCLINRETQGGALIGRSTEQVDKLGGALVTEIEVKRRGLVDGIKQKSVINELAYQLGRMVHEGKVGDENASVIQVEGYPNTITISVTGDVNDDNRPMKLLV